MTIKLAVLNEQQIISQYFFMPAISLKIGFGDEVYYYFLGLKRAAEATGYSYELIGWPNGTTIFLKRPIPCRDIDAKDIADIYQEFVDNATTLYMEVSLC